jgi:hypothetical protein
MAIGFIRSTTLRFVTAAAFGAALLCGDLLISQAAPPRYSRPQQTQRKPATTKPAPKPSASGTKPAAKVAPQPSNIPSPPPPRREAEPVAKPVPAATEPTKTETTKTLKIAPLPDDAGVEVAPAATMPAQAKSAQETPVQAVPAQTKPAPTAPRTSELFAPPPVAAATDKNGHYVFRYQFAKGETVRWVVEHQAKIASTVDGSSQTAETSTTSTKVWKVVETFPGGETKFVNSVADIDMRQKLTGRQETRYNSRTDKEIPPMFAAAAKQIGVPLAEITIDSRGNVQKRIDLKKAAEGGEPVETAATDITLVLPDKPLAVGESWTSPLDLWATDGGGSRIPIKARRKITLENVAGNIATLRHETQILSPLNDPKIEAQVVQSEQSGQVTFDLARGRIIKLSQSNDREVFGFQGDASVMHVEAAFTERLADAAGEPLPEAGVTGSDDPTTARTSLEKTTPTPASGPAVRKATEQDKTAERPTATKAK